MQQEADEPQRSPDKSVILKFLEMSSCMRIKLVKNVSATGMINIIHFRELLKIATLVQDRVRNLEMLSHKNST